MSAVHKANLAPPDPETELDELKRQFSQGMLANDAFFTALQAKLEIGDGVDKSEFPDFKCQPTLQRNEHGITLGVRLESSSTASGEGISLSVSAFDYIELAHIDKPDGQAIADPALIDLLKLGGMENPELGASSIGEAWEEGYNSIVRQFRGQITAGPSGTIELISKLESTGYIPE